MRSWGEIWVMLGWGEGEKGEGKPGCRSGRRPSEPWLGSDREREKEWVLLRKGGPKLHPRGALEALVGHSVQEKRQVLFRRRGDTSGG